MRRRCADSAGPRLPDGSGVDVCRYLRSHAPNIHCPILTAYDDDEAIYAVVIAGAAGYVVKDIRGAALLDYDFGLLSKLALQRRTRAAVLSLESRIRG